jgi:hypothetical protein
VVLGIRPGDLFALAREAQRGPAGAGHVVVSGPGAAELAEALAEGGDRSRVVVAGDPSAAAALVRIVGTTTTPDDEAVLRAGARAGAHLVAVRRGSGDAPVPYVLATDVVQWPDGKAVPRAELAAVLSSGLGESAPGLTAALPVLREAVIRRTILETAVGAAGLVAIAGRSAVMLPTLSLLQTRMLRRVRLLDGQAPPTAPEAVARTVGPELAAALATGLACRAVVRRLPVDGRLVRVAVAFAGTAGLGAVARRLPLP